MDQMRPFYDAARALYPLLPQWYELTSDGVTPEYRGLNAGGLPIFNIPQGYTLTADESAHEAGHAYFDLAPFPSLAAYWTFRGFPGTWHDAMVESQVTTGNAAWQLDPRESWAEAFARSVVTTHAEKTLTYGLDMGPLLLRAFFTSLNDPATTTAETGSTGPSLPVLLHNSHRAAGKTDGWSGAPGEAQYICDILNPRIVAALARYGIATVVVNGDMVWHPEYDADYLCFLAPHYESDTH